MLELAIKFLISYFLGSCMGSLLVGKLCGGIDIRTMGSGNAGGTNALRTQGIAFALGVMIVDIGKGALAAGFVPGMHIPYVGQSPDVARDWLVLCCAAAAVVGHVWPMWHQFRGGKGAATVIGTLAVIAPYLLLPVATVWLSVLVLSGFVGLSTIVAGIFAPLYVVVTRFPDDQPILIYCTAMAMYLAFSHRANVQRMRKGTESQAIRVMLFRRNR